MIVASTPVSRGLPADPDHAECDAKYQELGKSLLVDIKIIMLEQSNMGRGMFCSTASQVTEYS